MDSASPPLLLLLLLPLHGNERNSVRGVGRCCVESALAPLSPSGEGSTGGSCSELSAAATLSEGVSERAREGDGEPKAALMARRLVRGVAVWGDRNRVVDAGESSGERGVEWRGGYCEEGQLDSGDRSQKAASDEGLKRRLLGVLASPNEAGDDGEGRKGEADTGDRVELLLTVAVAPERWYLLLGGDRKRSGDWERPSGSSSLSSSDGDSSGGWSSSLPVSGMDSLRLGDSSGDSIRVALAYTRLLDAL